MIKLRPPLHPDVEHREVEFVMPNAKRLSPKLVSAISLAVVKALPEGDSNDSVWEQIARIEAISRDRNV